MAAHDAVEVVHDAAAADGSWCFGTPPEPGTLAIELDKIEVVRNRILHEPGYFTKWPSQQTLCVKSAKALGLNTEVMECIATWWCPRYSYCKILTIDVARHEASPNPKIPQILCSITGIVSFHLLVQSLAVFMSL